MRIRFAMGTFAVALALAAAAPAQEGQKDSAKGKPTIEELRKELRSLRDKVHSLRKEQAAARGDAGEEGPRMHRDGKRPLGRFLLRQHLRRRLAGRGEELRERVRERWGKMGPEERERLRERVRQSRDRMREPGERRGFFRPPGPPAPGGPGLRRPNPPRGGELLPSPPARRKGEPGRTPV